MIVPQTETRGGFLGYDQDGEGIRTILRRIGLSQHSADDLRLLREEVDQLLVARRQLNRIKQVLQGMVLYD